MLETRPSKKKVRKTEKDSRVRRSTQDVQEGLSEEMGERKFDGRVVVWKVPWRGACMPSSSDAAGTPRVFLTRLSICCPTTSDDIEWRRTGHGSWDYRFRHPKL